MEVTRKYDCSIIYSLLLHAAFLLAWGFYAVSSPTKTASRPESKYIMVEVDPLPTARAPKSSQVVQSEKGREVKEARPDAFLGERTQVADKQTMSMPKTGTAPQTSQGRTQRKERSETAQQSAPPAPPAGAIIQSTGALAKFGIAINAAKDYAPKPRSKSIIEEASLTAQARGEYVKGFKEGEETMLNTKEFVFYGYFQRLRERLDKAWEQSLRTHLTKYFYRGRQLASDSDYMTQLLVSLDSKGRVVRVQVVGASGTRDLDEAAVKAFNEAGPFPNPPTGLVTNGQVQVRWDFVLKT